MDDDDCLAASLKIADGGGGEVGESGLLEQRNCLHMLLCRIKYGPEQNTGQTIGGQSVL